MPGAGKTTVGRALAQLLQWGFVDVDDAVSDDIPGLIQSEGIDAFRARERAVIASLTPHDCVVAVGGGAVLDPSNREALRAVGRIVWLRANLATLHANVGDGSGRPLLAGDPRTALINLVNERELIYEECAHVAVDVDGLDPNEAAVEIVKALS